MVRVSDHLTPEHGIALQIFDIPTGCRLLHNLFLIADLDAFDTYTQLPSDQDLLDSTTGLSKPSCTTYHSLVRSRPYPRSAPRPERLANSGPFDRPLNINGPLHRTAYNGDFSYPAGHLGNEGAVTPGYFYAWVTKTGWHPHTVIIMYCHVVVW